MPLSIAEYLGQRTDVDYPNILPSALGGTPVPTCPFSGGPCTKLASSKPNHPVCSVRRNGEIFIVCSNRLIPAQARTITPSHMESLRSIASHIFPGISPRDIGFKRQIGVAGLFLDYILVAQNAPQTVFPTRIILEVQGGGETSSTGTITRHINEWASHNSPNNAFLSEQLSTEYLRNQCEGMKQNAPGIIPNNAWKRQLDQIVKKTPIAKRFSGGFVLVVGQILYEYITSKSIPIHRSYFSGWEIAIIGVEENISLITSPGAVPITTVSASTFMSFEDFIAAIQGFQVPEDVSDPFIGSYATLTNERFDIVRSTDVVT